MEEGFTISGRWIRIRPVTPTTQVQAAVLLPGDVTPYGTVTSVQSVHGRNAIVRVWFNNGAVEDFTRYQRVTVVAE